MAGDRKTRKSKTGAGKPTARRKPKPTRPHVFGTLKIPRDVKVKDGCLIDGEGDGLTESRRMWEYE